MKCDCEQFFDLKNFSIKKFEEHFRLVDERTKR